MNFQRSRQRVIWRFQENNSRRMLRADSFARCGLHERGKQNESGPPSVGITGRPTTGCSICRTDASSWSHISRLMVITIYHPGVTFSGVCMHVQQHGRLFVKDRVYLYTIAHTMLWMCIGLCAQNICTDIRVRVKRQDAWTPAGNQAVAYYGFQGTNRSHLSAQP